MLDVAKWGKRAPDKGSKKYKGHEGRTCLEFGKDSFVLQMLPPCTLLKTLCREHGRSYTIIQIRKLGPREAGLLNRVNKRDKSQIPVSWF